MREGCPGTQQMAHRGMFDTQEVRPVPKTCLGDNLAPERTELELEMLAIKRDMRQRSEKLVARSQAYMRDHPEVTELVADFFEAAVSLRPPNVYVFARDHFFQPAPVDDDDDEGEGSPVKPPLDLRDAMRCVMLACHDGHDVMDLMKACGVLVARRPHLARPKTQYVLGKDEALEPLPALDAGYGGLTTAVAGPAPAPLEGEDLFLGEEARARIAPGRIIMGAARHEWFEHDGHHATSFASVGEACTRCVGGAAVLCVAGSERAGAARRTAFALDRDQPLIVRVQQADRWDTSAPAPFLYDGVAAVAGGPWRLLDGVEVHRSLHAGTTRSSPRRAWARTRARTSSCRSTTTP